MKRMLKNVLSKYLSAVSPSRHIMVKIWLYTAAVMLAFSMLVLFGAQFFLNHFYVDSALERTAKNVRSTAEAASESIDSIILRFVAVCGTLDFKDIMFRIRNADAADYTELNNDLQDTLYNLGTCNLLVSSAVIISRQDMRFTLLSQQLTTGAGGYTLGYDPSQIRGLTFLPVCPSPIRGKGAVVPLAIPLAFLGGDSLLTIAPDAESALAILYLFLDAEALNKALGQYGEGKNNVAYLIGGDGTVLNASPGNDAFRRALEDGVFDLPSGSGGEPGETQSYRLGDQWVLNTRLGRRDLYLTVVISRDTLLSPLTKLKTNLLFASAASVLIMFLVSLFSAIFLSAPLRRLTGVVRTISDGTYTSDSMLHQHDEIGQLSEAIDTMYHTIQSQIEQIYEERRAKYNAEVRLFTEQINPHFLYNTLEFINLEVYNGHTENAAQMIQSLGSFMRIGLSFGSDQIPLEKELEHVQAYLTIMNHRFNHNICFTADIPKDLRTRRVLKIILQPIVENAIRHGFLLEEHNSFIQTPSIRIKCHLENEMLVLSVIDNGMGFDVNKITQIMRTSPDPRAHLGLNNVYTRLRLLYGNETDIVFQSIPYYRNTVSVLIPYRCTGADDNGNPSSGL